MIITLLENSVYQFLTIGGDGNVKKAYVDILIYNMCKYPNISSLFLVHKDGKKDNFSCECKT